MTACPPLVFICRCLFVQQYRRLFGLRGVTVLHSCFSVHPGLHRDVKRSSVGPVASADLLRGIYDPADGSGHRLRGVVGSDVGEGVQLDHAGQRGNVDILRYLQRP